MITALAAARIMSKLFRCGPALAAIWLACAVPSGAQSDEEKLPLDVASGWIFAKSLKLNFKPHGYTVVNADDEHPVRAGRHSIRFEVRAGDCSWNTLGFSDCDTDRERHELVQIGRTQRQGDAYWYGWSIYLPVDYPVVFPAKVALGQFHEIVPVIWLFRNKDGGYYVNRQDDFGASYGFDKILEDEEMRGVWNDIELFVRWMPDETGEFAVWLNGKQVYDYRGPTMQRDATPYFKFGIYRNVVSRYKLAKGVEHLPTQVVYYDEVRRGKTREEVGPRHE